MLYDLLIYLQTVVHVNKLVFFPLPQRMSMDCLYQKPLLYNRFLPYVAEIDRESKHLLEDIKRNLSIAVQKSELWPGALYWTNRLNRYLYKWMYICVIIGMSLSEPHTCHYYKKISSSYSCVCVLLIYHLNAVQIVLVQQCFFRFYLVLLYSWVSVMYSLDKSKALPLDILCHSSYCTCTCTHHTLFFYTFWENWGEFEQSSHLLLQL